VKIKSQFAIIISIVFLSSTPLFSQNKNDKIKGHWGGCSKEYGYRELAISDSLIYIFDLNFGGLSFPVPYEIKKDYTILNKTDTVFFNSLSSNLLTMKYNNSVDTLKLIDKLIPFENPDVYCELEMSPFQYQEYLDNQFFKRALKNKHKCISKQDVDLNLNAKIISSIDIDDFENQDSFKGVYSEKIEFEILEKNIENYQKPNIVELKKNPNNNHILIIVDYWGRCYEDFDVNFEIINDNIVNLTINQSNYSCDNICKMKLYIIAKEENYNLKNINLFDGK
jgi:hypothetical protein